ncbi:MAG: flippase-like domain-containing protein [Chloroflexi bacterium]|nr:flippase-like domain-containing protein [Chloroflexota bacterium]
MALATRLDLDWAALAAGLRGSNLPLFLLAGLLYYANFPLRGLRWRALAENVGLGAPSLHSGQAPPTSLEGIGTGAGQSQGHLPSSRAFGEAVFLGWFVNAIAWFRLGDPYRAYLIARQGHMSYAATLGTLVAERVIDLVSFAVLLGLAGLLLWAGRPDLTTTVLAAAVVLAAVAVLALVAMAALGPRLGRYLPGPARTWYDLFHHGTLGSLRRLPLLAALSLAAWTVEVGRLYLVAQALGVALPPPAAAFVALAHNLITALPLTPGGLGLAEAGMVGLLALRLPVESAVSVTVLDRVITYVSVVLLGGLLFAWRQGIRRGRL